MLGLEKSMQTTLPCEAARQLLRKTSDTFIFQMHLYLSGIAAESVLDRLFDKHGQEARSDVGRREGQVHEGSFRRNPHSLQLARQLQIRQN
jgi:hypothetical protein